MGQPEEGFNKKVIGCFSGTGGADNVCPQGAATVERPPPPVRPNCRAERAKNRSLGMFRSGDGTVPGGEDDLAVAETERRKLTSERHRESGVSACFADEMAGSAKAAESPRRGRVFPSLRLPVSPNRKRLAAL
jgi:hypothetical protein